MHVWSAWSFSFENTESKSDQKALITLESEASEAVQARFLSKFRKEIAAETRRWETGQFFNLSRNHKSLV